MDATINPVYLLRAYAWAVLKANMPDVWTETKYGGKEPIVPVAEEPDLDEYSGPHIVYGYALNSTNVPLYACKYGSMTLAVYDEDFRRLTKTMNVLQAAFERQDEAARDINHFTSARSQFIGLRFGSVAIGFVEGGTPESSEGGRQSALINITFDYYVDLDVITSV